MLRLLKTLPFTLAIAALSFLTASCGSGHSAQVRFINAIPDVPNQVGVDIEFNGTKDFTNVTFPNFEPTTGYKSVPPGNDAITGFQTNTTTSVFPQQNVSLASGSQYTVVATGSSVNNTVVIMNPIDTNTAPADGNVNFRIINASPSGPYGGGAAVDVYIVPTGSSVNLGSCTAPNCISNTGYKGVSGYVTIPYNSAGSGFTIYVTPTGSGNPVWSQTMTAGSASNGSIRTLVLNDVQGGGAMYTLATILSDLN